MAAVQVRICSDGTFHISGIKGDKVIDGGDKKSKKRYYIYNKHRYTKTVMHNKKKCIFCKPEQKFIPVKSLKGGVDGGQCETLPDLPDHVIALIKRATYKDNAIKDIFPFYLATAIGNDKQQAFKKFLYEYIKSHLKDDSNIVIELITTASPPLSITFNRTNIKYTENNPVDTYTTFLNNRDVIDFRYYGSDKVGKELTSFVGFLSIDNLMKKANSLAQEARTEINSIVKQIREINKTSGKSEQIKFKKIYLLLKEIMSLKKKTQKIKNNNNSSANSLSEIRDLYNEMGNEDAFVSAIIGKLKEEMTNLADNSDEYVIKDTIYAINNIIENPGDVDFEPDLDDNYLMYYGSDY